MQLELSVAVADEFEHVTVVGEVVVLVDEVANGAVDLRVRSAWWVWKYFPTFFAEVLLLLLLVVVVVVLIVVLLLLFLLVVVVEVLLLLFLLVVVEVLLLLFLLVVVVFQYYSEMHLCWGLKVMMG